MIRKIGSPPRMRAPKTPNRRVGVMASFEAPLEWPHPLGDGAEGRRAPGDNPHPSIAVTRRNCREKKTATA